MNALPWLIIPVGYLLGGISAGVTFCLVAIAHRSHWHGSTPSSDTAQGSA